MSDSADPVPGTASPCDPRDGQPPGAPANVSKLARPRFPFALKLTVSVGLTLTFLLALLLTGAWFYGRQILRNQVDAQLSAISVSRRDMVQVQVALLLQRIALNTDRGELRGFLYELAEGRPEITNRDGSQISLNRLADGKPILTASVVDETGRVVLSSKASEVGREVASSPEFQSGLRTAQVGWPRAVGGRFEATLAAPIRTRADPQRVYGVLMATVDVSDLAQALRDTTGLGQTGEALLGVPVGDQLRFLFPPRNSPQTLIVPRKVAPALAAAVDRKAAFFKAADYRGIPVLAASQPINYRAWALVVKMDEAEAYAPVRRALQLGALYGLAVIALGLVATYVLALRLTRPVRQLAEAAALVTGGNYATQVPVRTADELGALSASFNEMTAALRARREERDQAENALRGADQRKDEFLAMLGHELRNPLAAIAHAVRLEKEAAADPAAIELARHVIARQTGQLNRLVDDLLDVARITQGKIELRRSAVEIGPIVHRAFDTVRPLIVERRHQVDLLLADGGKWRVDADPTRLEQIITNLLTNAAKYTPDGGRITIVERSEGSDIIITVSDNGIGIAPEMLAKIFDLFTQADHSLDRTAGGLGLGLSLCRQLVALHGGTITAHSNGIGKGAAFTVRLPAIPTSETASPTPSPMPQASNPLHRRILLVDDNHDTVRALSRLLTRRGHEVATAYDGLTALEVARGFQPEVFLLDLGLPGLDGYELGRRLRSNGYPQAQIIAISGYAQESDRARSRAAGFNYHFAKPVDFEALAELIIEEPLPID